jgi:hypothetical protein
MSHIIDNPVTPVAVSVTVGEDGSVSILCEPNPVPVSQCNTLLAFTLDTSTGFRFRTTGAIELDEPDSDFPYPSWTLAPALATLYDLCNNIDTFKYSVYVVDARTGKEYSVDPEIKNGDVGV